MTKHTNGGNRLSGHFYRLSWVQMLLTGILIPGLTMTTPVLANPLGGVVVHGDVAIGAGAGGNLQINQASNRAIIDWASFSIDAGEVTQFIQPGTNSAVLNRVTGGDVSAIHGALKANGNVFVINPNGILVGAGGTIDVHGLALSTLDVSNGEFLAGGDLVFQGAGEGVKNLGRINAVGGDVFLIGKTVTNSGSITASGTVGLAAGEEVLLKAASDVGGERVFVRAAGSGVSGTGILNDGTIEGAAVELKAHGNLYALAINNKGSIRATGSSNSGGRVFLNGTGGSVSNSGSIRATAPAAGGAASVLIKAAYAKVDGQISATNGDSSGGSVRISGNDAAEVTGTIEAIGNGADGGSVVVEGSSVVIGDSGRIDVSGNSGGTINVGGGFQGSDSGVYNAESTTVAAGAILNADAVSQGDAGNVIVWANDTTEYFGTISAGASGAGNGGFVEVSGKRNLLYRGTVSTLSASGENGALLLDPTNFAIVDGTAGVNEISEADLETQLAAGDVIIATDGAGVDDGNITISGGVGWSSSGSLALLAHGDILFNAGVQNGGSGNVTAVAGWNGTTGFGGTPGSPQPGTVTFSDFTADTGSYGNAKLSGGFGSVVITGGATRVSVGSASGVTSVAGYGLDLIGGNATDGAAVLGVYGNGTGRIEVSTKEGGVNLTAGDESRAFARIGHGLNRSGSSASGSIDIDTLGSVNLLAGGDAAQATAAQDVFAQIGHGGILSNGNYGAEADLISVNAGTGVTLLASDGDNSYAAIGNGGLATGGLNQGDIIVETSSGDIQLIGSSSTDSTRDDSFAMIGHIRVAATGNAYGNIEVTASSGDVLVQSNAGSTSATQNFAQIGHGGAESVGNFGRVDSGGQLDSIRVTGETISVLGGAAGTEAQAQIGHGGSGSSGIKTGDIFLTATNASDQAILLQSGASADSYAQVGHGGIAAKGAVSGSVTIQSAGGVILDGSGGGERAYVQIGHGGRGHRDGDLGVTLDTITVNAANNVELHSGGNTQAYAMIGNGGYDADGNSSGVNSHRSDISVTAGSDGSGSVILRGTTAPNVSDDAFILIGNGGTSASGAHSGTITVTAADDVRLNTGDDNRNYAQIGNGGYDADGAGHSGDITVTTTSGSVILEGKPFGNSDYYNAVSSYAMVGNGGAFSAGNHSGDIEVTSGNAITLSGGRPDAGFEMIGHGGYLAKGDFSGSIEVIAQDDIDVLGGTNDITFAQIGHGGYDADGNHTADFINVTSVNGSIDVVAGSPGAYQNGNSNASNVYAQIGLGGVRAAGNMSAPVTVKASGDIKLTGGGNFNDYSQIGNGGFEASGDKSGAIEVTSEFGAVNVTAALRSADAYAQIGHGGVRVNGTLEGDISVSSSNSITLSGGTREAVDSFAQIGHGGLESVGNKSGAIELNAGIDLAVIGGTAERAYALVGHGGVESEGFFDGSIDITLGGALDVFGGNGATAGLEGDLNFGMIGHSLAGAIGGFGGFMGSDGRVVVEGEYFNSAVSWVALDEGTSLPSQQNGALQYQFSDIRGGAYIQAPDGGTATGPSASSVASYTFTVSEDGTYRLIPKAAGYNGNSDSLYFSIAELRDGTAADGSNVNADWYEFTGRGDGNLTWDTSGGGAELNTAGDPNQAPLWDLVAGQTYTMEVRAREDGVAVDAWALELDSQYSSSNYSGDGPGVTFANKSGVSGASDINISAGGNINLLSGENSDSYAAIGHGGSSFQIGVSANVDYGTDADGADISVATSAGDIRIDGNSVAGAGTDAARRYAAIGHHGVDAGFDAYGDVNVQAGAGSVVLTAGEATDSFVQIGHGSAGDFIDAQSTLLGDIYVAADTDISLTSPNGGLRSSAQIGHGAFGIAGDFSGDISVATTTGDVVLTGGALSTGQYAQIGHGGSGANGALAGDIEVAAVAGDVTATGSNDATNYAMIGHGAGDGSSSGTRGGGVQLFAGDVLTAVNGTTDNAYVFHQTAGGLNVPGNYLGGNGFQLIGANGVTLPDSALGGISAMITGNIANGPVFIATDYDDGPVTIDAASLATLNDDLNRVIAIGGDITLLSSFQNAGSGDVMLLAGYNGDGTTGGTGSFNATSLEVAMNGSLVADFNNCAADGSRLTIGSTGQTIGLAVGSRTGVTALGAETVTLTAGSNLDAYSQIGFFTNGSGAATGEISIGTGSGGLAMTSGNADGAYTQIGHGGNNAGTDAVSSNITISFCEPGDLLMDAGDGLAAYSQIGHGGNENVRNRSNASSDILITGFRDAALNGGEANQAYAQIGHGGFSGSGLDGGTIDLSGSGSLQLTAGAIDAYVQIGHGGKDQVDGGSIDDHITIEMGSFVSLEGGSDAGAYAQIGHGGAGSAGLAGDLTRTGNITVSAGGADGSGNAITIRSGSGDDTYAQIGLGGLNADSSYAGNIDIDAAGDVELISGTGLQAYSQIGHGGFRSFDGTRAIDDTELEQSGDISIDTTAGGSLNLQGLTTKGSGALDAYTQVGHGGTSSAGDTDGKIDINVAGGIAMQAGGDATGNDQIDRTYSQIGHGGVDADGRKSGDITITAVDTVQIFAGVGEFSYAQIGHGGVSENSGVDSGQISITTTGSAGNLDLRGGNGGDGWNIHSYGQIGHGGRASHGVKSGDITLSIAGGISLINGNHDGNYKQIGHGGSGTTATITGAINVTANGNIDLVGGTNDLTAAQIGHGGSDSDGSIDANAFNAANQSGVNVTSETGRVMVKGGSFNGDGADGRRAYAQIGSGGFSYGLSADTVDSDITVNAATGISLDGGGRDFNYAMIGNGGSLSEGSKSGDIEVSTVNGAISVYASEKHELAQAQIGHGGFRGLGATDGSIHVKALNGTVALLNGGGIDAGTDGGDFYRTTPLNASYSYAQIGHGGAQAGDYDRDGEICVVGINGVSLASSGSGDRAYTQIGHGGYDADGELTGDISVVSTAGGVTVSADGTGSEGQYAQIGHGGISSDGRMSANISVIAGAGDTSLRGGAADFSFAMIGNGDGSKTSTGTRAGGIHLFSSGQLIGTNGAGTESNVFIFHQNANGLQAADYEGGDGYQKVANGGINLAASAIVDESNIINGNLGHGTITIVDNSQTDYLIDAAFIGDSIVDTPEDFYIITGGNITMTGSFQNSGIGDVTLLAGWNGVGNPRDGTVEFGDPLTFCEPIIKTSGYDVDFTNHDTFGNNGKTLTVGSVNQTGRVSVGSAGGTNTFAGAAVHVLGSDSDSNAGTQLGYFADGTTDIFGEINVYVKEGGLLLDGGNEMGSFAQIGHGGSGSTSGALLDAPITVTFCADSPPGALELRGGGDGSYAQIGHGGPASGGSVSGKIDINGAGSLTLNSNTAYTQIGHGGDAAGLTTVTNSAIEIDVLSFIDLNAGSGTFDYAQIGHVGRNPQSTDVVDSDILINTATDRTYGTGAITMTAGGSNAYVQIGHGGARNDGTGNFATHSGDITIGRALSISVAGGTATDAYAQIGHGGEGGGDGIAGEVEGDFSGNISITTAGLLAIEGGSSFDNYAQVGHGGEQSFAAKSGDIRIESGGVALSSRGGSEAYSQIGHGGELGSGDASGAISIVAGGDISLTGGAGLTATALIGHGSGVVNSEGSRSGELNVFTTGSLTLTDGASTSALISHQTLDGAAAVDYGLLGEDDSSYSLIALGGITLAADSDQQTGSGDIISFAGSLAIATGSGDVTIASGGTSSLSIGSDGDTVSFSESGDLSILSGGDLTVLGGLSNAGSGNIGLLAGWANTGSTAAAAPDVSGAGVPDFTPIAVVGPIAGAEYGLNNAALNIGDGNQSVGISVGSKSGTTTAGGNSISLAGSDLSDDAFSQIGFRGDATGSIVVQAGNGGLAMDGGSYSGSYTQIGHGGAGSGAVTIDADVSATSTGDVVLSGGTGEGAYAQIGNGGLGSFATKDGDVTVVGASVSLISGGASSYTQIGSGGLMTHGDVESTIQVSTTVGGILLNGGGSDNAYALIGSGGAIADGQLDGDIIVNSAAGIDVLGGGTAGDALTGTRNFAQIGHSVQGFFIETVDGIFFVDALDYTTRHSSWIEVPYEGPSNPAGVYSNATNDDYLHLPNGAGGLAAMTGSAVTYELDITTPGTYRLLPRWVGYDGGSDSVFFDVVELKDGNGGPIADYYEFAQSGTGDFNSTPFTAVAGAEQSDGSSAGHSAATFDFNTAGTYTVRITPREDGVAVDSFVLQLASLPIFGAEGPALTREAPGVGDATGNISVTAVDDINLVAGINSDSYATIGHGGSDRNLGNHASYGTAVDSADITVTSTGGSITLDGGQSMGDNIDTVRRYASIGHHGADGAFDSYGDIHVDAAGGSVMLNSGAVADSSARIGHGGASTAGSQNGSITVNALDDLILLGGTGVDAAAQIGHSGGTGTFAGAITAISGGAMNLNGGDATGAFSQIGHGGTLVVADLSGAITTTAGGALSVAGGGTNAYAQVGHGGSDSQGNKSGDLNVIASEVLLEGGSGNVATARIGHGGSIAKGDLTGNVSVTSTVGDIFLIGDGIYSDAQIGNGGRNYEGEIVDQSVTVNSANDIFLLSGGDRSTTLIGNGGADFHATALSGDITVAAANSIGLISGGMESFSQIGNGGYFARADISGETRVTTGGGSILLDASSGATGAYAKIGHGDDLDSGSGRGDRSGDILVAAATDVTLAGGMIGQINSTVDPGVTTSLSGVTRIGVSQLDPGDASGGILTADAESEFQGTESLEFYLPRRENNAIAAGALLNGSPYAGPREDPTVDQLPDEFAVNVITPAGVTIDGNIADNLIGASRDTAGTTPLNFGFYFDTIELTEAPPVVVEIPDVVDSGEVDPGDSGFEFDFEFMSAFPADDRLVDDEQRKAEQRYSGFNPYAMYYEGYDQYDSNGNSIFHLFFTNGLTAPSGGN